MHLSMRCSVQLEFIRICYVFVIREEYFRIGFKDFILKLKLLFKWNMFKQPSVTKGSVSSLYLVKLKRLKLLKINYLIFTMSHIISKNERISLS